MKKIISFVAAILMLLCLPLSVSAAEEGDLTYWYSDEGMVIYVRWDVEQPKIQFVDPDGVVYDPTVEQTGTVAAVIGNTLYYYIEAPAQGRWLYSYEKGKNTTVELHVQENNTPLEVTSFTIGEVTDNRLDATFMVSGPEDQHYSYRISAVVDGITGEKELSYGYGYTAREETVTVYLDSLSSYSAYKLKLYVYYEANSVEVYDIAYSEAFSVTNTSGDENTPAFCVTVQPDEYLLFVNWGEVNWQVESILVAVFEDGAEPSYDTYDPNEITGVQLSFAPSTKVVEVEMSAKVDGVSTTPIRKKLTVADMALSCPTEDAVNYVNYPITYTGIDKVMAELTVNDQTSSYQLEGDGILNVPLNDNWNELSLSYTDSQGVIWQISRKVFVDRLAPVLNMSQEYDGMAVEGKKLVVSGTVLDYHSVTVNDKEVTVNSDGSFSMELDLADGENILTVVAKDALGNESRYAAKVFSGKVTASAGGTQNQQQDAPGGFAEKLLGEGKYWALLGSGIIAVLVVGYALIFWRKEKKDETV